MTVSNTEAKTTPAWRVPLASFAGTTIECTVSVFGRDNELNQEESNSGEQATLAYGPLGVAQNSPVAMALIVSIILMVAWVERKAAVSYRP